MIKYRNDLELTEYIVISQVIAGGYFDIDGNYQPHYGIINAYRLFYNNCVTRSPYDDKYGHDIERIEELEEIISDRDFISAFDECIHSGEGGLTFSSAYAVAMDIVENRNSSLNTLISAAQKLLHNAIDQAAAVLSAENMEYMRSIAEDIKSGKIGGDAVVDAYCKRLNQAAEREEAEQSWVADETPEQHIQIVESNDHEKEDVSE